jgi:protein ImuB
LQELEKFLQARDCGITWMECRLRHRHASPTLCLLRLATPVADAQRLSVLLGEKLMTLVLPEPVRSCELRTGLIVPRPLSSSGMWQAGERGGEAGAEVPQLVEHLRARLGDDAVYGLQLVAGHRPEKSWRSAEPGAPVATESSCGAFRRPLWLLPVPQILDEDAGQPRYRGPLQLFANPERIETGWWDGEEAIRDYYIALDIYGVRLWIFREREEPHRWFLHGMFG